MKYDERKQNKANKNYFESHISAEENINSASIRNHRSWIFVRIGQFAVDLIYKV